MWWFWFYLDNVFTVLRRFVRIKPQSGEELVKPTPQKLGMSAGCT